jgi:autotransporter-associated beta strand protein
VGAFTNTVVYTFGDASSLAGANTNLSTTNVTVTGAVYDHAQGSLSSSNVSFRVHVGYAAPQTTNVGISNAAGFRVSLTTLATNSSNNLSLTGVAGVSNGVSSNAILTFNTNQGAGAFTNVIGVVYGDDSTLAGASSTVGTNFLTVSGLVYTGQSTWTTNSGNWTNFANWSALGGTPGLDGSLSTNDSAAFGGGAGGTVTLNTNARLNALTFSNASSSYTLGGSGTISLLQGTSAPLIANLAGSHTITTPLNLSTNLVINSASGTLLTISSSLAGTGTLNKTGSGSLALIESNSYSGSTIVNEGTLVTANRHAIGNGSLTLNGSGSLTLQSLLTLDSFAWNSSLAYVAIPSLSATSYLNVTNSFTPTSGGTNYFDLSGAVFGTNATQIMSFGTNSLSDFSTNQFGILNAGSGFMLNIATDTHGLAALFVSVATLPVTPGGITTVSGTNTYPSVSFGSNSILNITQSGNLSIQTNVLVNDSSTLNVDGALSVTNSVIVQETSTLMGVGTIYGNVVSKGTLSALSMNTGLPGKMTITGNLNVNPSDPVIVSILNQSLYSQYAVGGTLTLGGEMVINPLGGYQLSFGQQFADVFTAGGGITGAFDSIVAPAGFRGRLLLGNNSTTATLLIAPASYTQLAATQNQLNVARALDTFIPATSGDKLVVSTALDKLTASQYPQAFEAIQPTLYQSLSTIAFNLANAQNMELNQRLWSQRLSEGGGFSMSGFAANTPFLEGQGDGKSVLDAKDDILRPGPDNRWGLFVDGNGIFAQANSGNMLPNYNAQSGGVTTGVTFRVNPTITIGAYTGYEGTYAKYNGGSSIIDNSVRFGVFGTYGKTDGRGFYVNAILGGGYNQYQVTRNIQFPGINRTANSQPAAGELNTMLAGGYNFRKGNWTFGPTTSLQYTYLGVNGFSETGAQSLNLTSGGWNTASLLGSLGAQVSYTWQATKDLVVIPQMNLSWQHEFLQNSYAINSTMGGANFANLSNAPLRDYLYTGIGVTFEFKQKWFTSIFYNAAAGNSNLQSQNIFWSLGCKF